MGDAHKGFPCKGVIVGWRRDRGHGQIADSISRRQYLAAFAGNAGPSLEPGVDLVGRAVRYCVESTHLPVKWILDEYGEPEAAELTAAAEPLLPARQIVAKECNSANATVPPQIASGAQDQDHSVTLEQAGTNSLPVSVDLSAAASAAQEQCARVANQYNLDPEETKELILLLREMKAIGFTHSNQLSKYIMEKRLASKYPNISGIVRMELDGRQWDFRGGFPPQIYAIVCRELGLDNQRSRAVPVDFTSYKELSASPASGQRQMMGKPAQRDTPPKSNHRATTRLQLR